MIKDIAGNLNIKQITIEKSLELYKEVEDSGKLKGKSVNAKVAAVIFVASRKTSAPK